MLPGAARQVFLVLLLSFKWFGFPPLLLSKESEARMKTHEPYEAAEGAPILVESSPRKVKTEDADANGETPDEERDGDAEANMGVGISFGGFHGVGGGVRGLMIC